MIEIFKDIEGYKGYQVSNYGNVKSLNYNRTGKEKILKPTKNSDGYLQVSLHKDGKRKTCKVHRLVAQTFIENPNNLPQVNHKDENKQNNNVENLEFCDSQYNINYGTRNEKISKQVMCVETGVVYPSTMEVQRELGFFQTHITLVCNGKRNTAYKFHWCYV